MIASLVILAFLAAMAIIWSRYGLFSAFLHMVIVIVAGALAFATWEPLAQVLLGRMPRLAWGVALVGPFALWLIALRVAMDKLVRSNLHFAAWVDKLGGAVFAVVAGLLTAGVTLIGVQFLGVSGPLLNYTPYGFASDSTPERQDELWLPADSITATFYTVLSAGAFGTSTPLAVYRPELAAEAGQAALLKDKNASPIALKKEVEVAGWAVSDGLPEGVHPSAARALKPAVSNSQLVVVDTTWEPGSKENAFAYDGEDRNLRLHRHHVQLITRNDRGGGRGRLHLPVGYIVAGRDGVPNTYYPFGPDVDWALLSADNAPNQVGWVFAIDDGREPALLHARQQVLPLPGAASDDAAALARHLGRTPDQPVRDAWDAFVAALYNRQGPAVAAGVSTQTLAEIEKYQKIAADNREKTIEGLEKWEQAIVRGMQPLLAEDPTLEKKPGELVTALAARGALPEPPRTADGSLPTAEAVSITRISGVPTATVTLAGSGETVKLRRDGEVWKVDLFSVKGVEPSAVTAGGRQGITAGQEAQELVATNDLPRPISANGIRTLPNRPGGRLSTREVDGQNLIDGGAGIAPPARAGERTSRIVGIYAPSGKRMARLEITGTRARSLFGQAFSTVGDLATSAGNVAVVTDRGAKIPPTAYVIAQADGSQQIVVAEGFGFGAGNPIPIRDLKRDESMYLYFQVNPGTRIEKYEVGRSSFDVPLTIR